MDTDYAGTEGVGSDTPEHEDNDGTDENNNTTDSNADIPQQCHPSGRPMCMNR